MKMTMKMEYEKPETEVLSVCGETDLMGPGGKPGGLINPGQNSQKEVGAKEYSDDDIAWDDNIDIWNNANNY